MSKIRMLTEAFGRSYQEPPSDLAGALRELPAVGDLPSPWATWTLVELVRHRRRQVWARELLRERFRGRFLELAMASCQEGEGTYEGYVPGSPQWEFLYEGLFGYCSLSDRGTGETVCVVFGPDEDAEGYFFNDDLIREWGRRRAYGAGPRLLQLHPSLVAVYSAFAELTEAGMIEQVVLDGFEPGDCFVERLTPAVVAHADAIDDFVGAWEDRKDERDRVWQAALIGDWLAASAAAIASSDPGLIALTKARAGLCRSRRIARLRRDLARGYSVSSHTALWDMGDELPRDLSRASRDDA